MKGKANPKKKFSSFVHFGSGAEVGKKVVGSAVDRRADWF